MNYIPAGKWRSQFAMCTENNIGKNMDKSTYMSKHKSQNPYFKMYIVYKL